MTLYRLTETDARLAYLAIAYHLGRPGSELDARTQRPAEHGLGEVARALEAQLSGEGATVELDERQQARLLNAVGGAINELKAYPLMPEDASGARRTAAPRFAEVLVRLFPGVAKDPDEAVQLAAHMLALRRRLEAARR